MLFALTEFVIEAGVWMIRSTWSVSTWIIWGHQPTPGEIAMEALTLTNRRLESIETNDMERRLEEIEKTQNRILQLLEQQHDDHGTTETETTTHSNEA